VWNDDPTAESEAEIAAGIAPRLRVIAQKTWKSPLLVRSYADFTRLARRLGDG
jgi:hexosaminidase